VRTRGSLPWLAAAAGVALSGSPAAAESVSGLPISRAVLERRWTGSWIACARAPERDPGVFRFRRVIELPAVPARFVVHASGDQRFVLHVNGRRVGAGPSRGDILFWRFQTFDLAPFLKPGANLLTALVWNFGTEAPAAQISDRTGFVLQGDGDAERAVNTDASWECAVVQSQGAVLDGFPERGGARVPPQTKAWLLLDRETLVTGYPELVFSGGRGARVRIGYQEAPLEPERPWRRGHRDDFDGKDADGGSVPVSLQLALALGEAADLEAALGEPERAGRYRERQAAIVAAVRRLAWDEGRGLVADTPARSRFSQQANILALLADAVPEGHEMPVLERVLALPRPSILVSARGGAAPDVARASVYFRFYLSRALEKLGEGERCLPELEPWREMLDVGLSTFAEIPDAAVRSDCHAWSAHPNYDLLRLVAGLEPGSQSFRLE
jgi:hypothetical protein